MTLPVAIALSFLALCGHTALWSTTINRIHATTLPKAGVMVANLVCLGLLTALPVVYAGWFLGASLGWLPGDFAGMALGGWYYYGCAIGGVVALGFWTRRKLRPRRPFVLRAQSANRYDMVERLGQFPAGRGLRRLITRLPGNECFQLEVSEKELEIAGLAASLDGVSIAHLSDLHFSHAVDKQYFVEIVDIANALDPDFIVVTGDLVDRVGCIDWVPETLGRLRARSGVYAIFGNHDVRLKKELARLRLLLTECGLHYVGRQWRTIDLGESRILVVGNELPWIKPVTNMAECPSRDEQPEMLRLLLAHSPDQYGWARRHDFDLMLAGHNHGGQVCLPVVGPIFSPSRSGVRYAAGVFHEPPTVLHVSRGISALDPIRYNCPPELSKLVLRAPVRGRSKGEWEQAAALASTQP